MLFPGTEGLKIFLSNTGKEFHKSTKRLHILKIEYIIDAKWLLNDTQINQTNY